MIAFETPHSGLIHPDDQTEYLVFLYGTLLAADGTVPETEEPG